MSEREREQEEKKCKIGISVIKVEANSFTFVRNSRNFDSYDASLEFIFSKMCSSFLLFEREKFVFFGVFIINEEEI